MAPSKSVPVPKTTTTRYLVLTRTRVRANPEPGLDVDDHTNRDEVPIPPAPLLLARGSAVTAVERVPRLRNAAVVSARTSPRKALRVEQEARAYALGLATKYDGVVVDIAVPRLLAPESVGVAAQLWFVFSHDGDTIETHGLTRFGLPELRAAGIGSERLAMYDAVLVGLAQRLIEEWPDNDPVGPATVTLRDIARGYGDAASDSEEPELARSVDLTITNVRGPEDDYLSVTLHDDPATLFT